MMLPKKRGKPSYHTALESLVPPEESAAQKSDQLNDKTPEFGISHQELYYIGHKAASIQNHVLKLLEVPDHEQSVLDMLQDLELARFSARKLADGIALPMPNSKDGTIKNIEVQMPDMPILLQLTLFPLVPYPIKGAYNVYYDVKEALFRFTEKQPFRFDATERFTLVYQRLAKGTVRLSTGCCDNDNFEMKRVTNAITEAIGIADSADKFSFYYTTITGSEAKTRVFLVYEKDFPLLLNDNRFKNDKSL